MEDVSNKVIFVLVILTVVISVFSTVLMLSANDSITKGKISEPVSTGRISYNIVDPSMAPVASAKIAYNIEKPE